MWDMCMGDNLKYEILQLTSDKQRLFFLSVFERMKNYIQEHEKDETLTFREYFEMFER